MLPVPGRPWLGLEMDVIGAVSHDEAVWTGDRRTCVDYRTS